MNVVSYIFKLTIVHIVCVKIPGGGGTQHMYIRGGKSDIFGLEYCQK